MKNLKINKKIEAQFKNQLEDNINSHMSMSKMFDEILDSIQIIKKNYKKVENYYFVVTVVQLLTRSI